MAADQTPLPVYLESGSRRVFACAIDWPGWSRSGKDESTALDALAASAGRYAVVAKRAKLAFPAAAPTAFEIVEEVPGSATTDFGAPGSVPDVDRESMTAPQARRIAGLLAAAWWTFERAVAQAPQSLRKGPRGGGRDRDAMVEHVHNAEAEYARKLGIPAGQRKIVSGADVPAMRAAITAMVLGSESGAGDSAGNWPPRYAVRRIAWHVLDHAWEIEDRG